DHRGRQLRVRHDRGPPGAGVPGPAVRDLGDEPGLRGTRGFLRRARLLRHAHGGLRADAPGGDGLRRPRTAAHPHGSGGPPPPHVRGVPTVTSHFVYLVLRSRSRGMLSRISQEPFGGTPPPPPTSHFALELWESILVLRENRSQAAHEQAGTAAPPHPHMRS